MNQHSIEIFERLHAHYGPQHWWPGDTPFEIIVGAVLTQNTAWTNVERAIANLKAADHLNAQRIIAAPTTQLAELLRPAGYFNVKARRLYNACHWFVEQGETPALNQWHTLRLRAGWLSVNGIGPETADDIVLYAFNRPVFVIDAYTRRLFQRLGHISGTEGYETLRHGFETHLSREPRDRVALFNEYHALIVIHAKTVCKTKPRCGECCLAAGCLAAQNGRSKQ